MEGFELAGIRVLKIAYFEGSGFLGFKVSHVSPSKHGYFWQSFRQKFLGQPDGKSNLTPSPPK